jgi:fucose 4-O-acetylase-like acetyltransferase
LRHEGDESLEKTQTLDVTQRSRLITEFNYLKIFALFLLLFVHSDLIFSYPSIIYPVQWFLLSAFFFISGFLAYDSFRRRENSIRRFFKSKIKKLYVPFMGATIFYFVMQSVLGVEANFVKLVSQVSMLNIFDRLNSIYNWGSLWFIPYLLAFMLIICVLEKYFKSTRVQLLIISAIWLSTILLWVYDSPFQLGQLFSEFLLVFVFGFFVNKFKIYDKLMSFKMAFFAIPLVAFFSLDLSGLFTYTNEVETFKAMLYSNGRIMILTVGLVLLSLLLLRKMNVPKNGFAKQVASRSAFIYLSEPFISFVILAYAFGIPDDFFADGVMFYVYQIVRVAVLLVLVPLGFIAWKKFKQKRISPQSTSPR